MNGGRVRARRKTQWRPVNLANFDTAHSDFSSSDLPPWTGREKTNGHTATHRGNGYHRKNGKGTTEEEEDRDFVTTRSEWKYMGKKVRKMLIPGSISAFASCMWVSLEMLHGSPIAAFSKIVELALPFWDALPSEEQDAWAERAFAEKRRSHWIYVRNGRSKDDTPPRKKKTDEWDYDYDDDDLSDTDELPSRPTSKLNIDGDDVVVSKEQKPILKQSSDLENNWNGEDSSKTQTSMSTTVVRPKRVTFVNDGGRLIEEWSEEEEHTEEAPAWTEEQDAARRLPPPPATYRPIIVQTAPKSQPPPVRLPYMQNMNRKMKYPSRAGFDAYPQVISHRASGFAPVNVPILTSPPVVPPIMDTTPLWWRRGKVPMSFSTPVNMSPFTPI